jgi:cytochrome c peroxidase
VAALVLPPSATTAHVVKQEGWHPVPAAYLYGMFAAGLEPVDWDGIAERFETTSDKFLHQGPTPVYELLKPASGFAGADFAAEIRAAIAAKDAARFRAVSSRAVSAAVRDRLAAARKGLAKPRAALPDVLLAERLYRAFADYVRETDADAYKAHGTAWLELATLAGAPKPAAGAATRFDSAAGGIAGYLEAKFEVKTPDFSARKAPWLPPDAHVVEQEPLPRLMLNSDERGISEKKLFMVAYGDMLFDSPVIFGEPARSLGLACSGCHNRGEANRAFYIPGLSIHRGGVDVDSGFFNPRANNHRLNPVDIPSLRGIRFTAPYGRDGRIASLREFTRNVIVNEFAGAEPTPFVLDALVAYMNEFDFLPAPFLYRDGRLNASAPEAAKRGERLFNKPMAGMNGQSCASCHIPSAYFLDHRRHDIGSGNPSSPNARDSAFDTPTLIGAAHTAPYFHDGSLPTLAAVVDWFNTRFALKLTAGDRGDLTAYLEAVGAGERPHHEFDDRNTPFKLAFEELSTFLSTLDTLLPARDKPHAALLLETVATDLRADAVGIADFNRLPRAGELADRLEAIARAVTAEDWTQAEALWAEYKRKEEAYAADMF